MDITYACTRAETSRFRSARHSMRRAAWRERRPSNRRRSARMAPYSRGAHDHDRFAAPTIRIVSQRFPRHSRLARRPRRRGAERLLPRSPRRGRGAGGRLRLRTGDGDRARRHDRDLDQYREPAAHGHRRRWVVRFRPSRSGRAIQPDVRRARNLHLLLRVPPRDAGVDRRHGAGGGESATTPEDRAGGRERGGDARSRRASKHRCGRGLRCGGTGGQSRAGRAIAPGPHPCRHLRRAGYRRLLLSRHPHLSPRRRARRRVWGPSS